MTINNKLKINLTTIESIILQCDADLPFTITEQVNQIQLRQLQQLNEDYRKYYSQQPAKLENLISQIKSNKSQIFNYKGLIKVENENKYLVEIVSAKIVKLIEERKALEENFSFIQRFWNRLGHFFKFHGFNTTAEWAQKVQNDLFKDQNADYFRALRFFKPPVTTGEKSQPSLEEAKDSLSKLPPNQIKLLIKQIKSLIKYRKISFPEGMSLKNFLLTFPTDAQKQAALEALITEYKEGALLRLFYNSPEEDYNDLKQIIPNMPPLFANKVIKQYFLKSNYNKFLGYFFFKHEKYALDPEKYGNLGKTPRLEFQQVIAELVAQNYISKKDYLGFISFFDKNFLGLGKVIQEIVKEERAPIILSKETTSLINKNIEFDKMRLIPALNLDFKNLSSL